MELITGYAGKPHVYPADDAAQNRGTITGDNVVLNVDEKFAYELVYNNTIRIKSGTAVFQGRVIRIRANLYDELTIENGTQALIRNDLIVARYTYEEGIESATLTVVKGIPGETGTDPEIYDENNIDQGDTICDMPLYRVVINGLNIESVTPLFKTIKGLKELEQAVNEAIKALNTALTQELSGKAPSSHKHTSADVTDLDRASVKYAQSAGGVDWDDVSSKPSSFTPSNHTHDDRYYTETEINSKLSAKFDKGGGSITGSIQMALSSVLHWNNQARVFSNGAQHIYLTGSSDANYALHLGVHDNMWTLDPDVSGNLNLGTGNHKFGTLYAVNGTISTSDRDQKNTIKTLDDRYAKLLVKLLPCSFKFNEGTSGRTHVGFISQDVEAAMTEVGLTDLDFAGFCKDQKTVQKLRTVKIKAIDEAGKEYEDTVTYMEDVPVEGEYTYSLRYEEFIALNTAAIQNLIKRVEILETKINH